MIGDEMKEFRATVDEFVDSLKYYLAKAVSDTQAAFDRTGHDPGDEDATR